MIFYQLILCRYFEQENGLGKERGTHAYLFFFIRNYFPLLAELPET